MGKAQAKSEWIDDVGGHDVHFLRRLERVSSAQTDLALRLYRDPKLVHALIAEVLGASPDPRARVAVPLGGEADAPVAIVGGGGGFITCLGAGMYPYNLAHVPWEKVRSALRQREVAEKQYRKFKETSEVVDFADLDRRFGHAGGRLDRESFAAAEAMAPILAGQYLRQSLHAWKRLLLHAPTVARLRDRPGPDQEALRLWWNTMWESIHAFMVVATQGPRFFAMVEEKTPAVFNALANMLLWLIRMAPTPVALRALWIIGRAGKYMLPALRAELAGAADLPQWIPVALALQAVACRQRRLVASIRRMFSDEKMVADLRGTPNGDAIRRYYKETLNLMCGQVIAAGESDAADAADEADCDLDDSNPEPPVEHKSQKTAVIDALKVRFDLSRRLEIGHLSLQEQEDAINKVLPTLMANLSWDTCEFGEDAVCTMIAMSVLMRAPAQAFYVPEVGTAQLGMPFSAKATIEMASPWRPDGPVRAAPRPGRNEPCTCGSGKKQKKCCG